MDLQQLEVHKQGHTAEAVARRLGAPQKHSYVSDAVLGGIDGCITTFAIVASSVGAGFPHGVAIVLGLANILADGLSMAVSNYEATKSDQDIVASVRQEEERHIDIYPEGEREEVRQIYAAKGLSGAALDAVVDAITADKERWIDTMIRDEHGLSLDGPNAFRAGFVTFVSFVFVGFIPLIPFFLPLPSHIVFTISSFLAAMLFFGIGVWKGIVLNMPSVLKSGLWTLMSGSVAALLAYFVGDVAQSFFLGPGFHL